MKLSYKMSDALTKALYKNDKIAPEYVDAYQYCLEQLFDLIIYHAILLCMGAILQRFSLTILYIITLTPTKMLAGGAHAESIEMCSIISFSIFLITLFVCPLIPLSGPFSILLFLPTETILWILAPVCHPNKPLTDSQRKTSRRILLVYFFLLDIIGVVLILFNRSVHLHIILLCLMIVLINQVLGRILYRNY